MTIEELGANKPLLKELRAESVKLIEAGMEPTEARIKIFREHGIEFDEDAAHAAEVSRMKLSEEKLEHVAGGTDWCASAYACSVIVKHDAGDGNDCFSAYSCTLIQN